MKLLLVLLFVSANAFSLDWRYRTFDDLKSQATTEWKPVNGSRHLVNREYQGFIEYETLFDVDGRDDLAIYLGEIGDVDKVFVNGILIGQTGDFPPFYSYNMDIDRLYFIPKIALSKSGRNRLSVTTFTKYFVNKGLNTREVEIGKSSELHHKKYINEILDNFSKMIVPLLCLILAAISFPALAPKALFWEQMVIFFLAISSFVLGLCRGRIGFHFFEMLPTYKMTIGSSIVTIWLIAVNSIGFKSKSNKILSGNLSIAGAVLLFLLISQSTLLEAAMVAKAWFHVAPVFIVIAIVSVFQKHSSNIPLKIGLIVLLLADLNDVLHDLKLISSIPLLQVGLGSFVLFLILNQLARLRKSWELFFKKEYELEADAKLGRQAVQLAHDIRSPLEALKSAKDEIARLPELERTSVNLAIGRIEEIAYNLLLIRKRKASPVRGKCHIKSTLFQVLQEKSLQYRNFPQLKFSLNSDEKSFGTFAFIDTEIFKRILSNILDNAAEAIKLVGNVELELLTGVSTFQVRIIDSGPKISDLQMRRIFEKGFTTKNQGNGLGLFHAKKEIEASNGSVKFTQNDKTSVEITLPLCDKPKTFTDCIDLTNVSKILVFDDDESIHQIWIKRFKNIDIHLEHFYKASELLTRYSEIPSDTLLLSDYELLGEDTNGIECIKRLGSFHNSILVTARADEPHILKNCERLGIKVLPKSLSNEILIKNDASVRTMVLIDDDKMTHLSWQIASKKAGIELKTFFTVNDFLFSSDNIPVNAQIYVDSNLGGEVKGEVASEEIFNRGFTDLYMATGFRADEIDKPVWIKEIIGKQPPF